MIIIYEDYGGGHRVGGGGESLHFDFFKRETSFTLEYESGSIGRRERKRCCL